MALRITELDFDNIKNNLKDFLKAYKDENGDNVFTDYEFEGSSLSVLLDLLAYNTHYNAYFANMLANELFLDSTVKRQSAVSIAKQIGYTPISARGAAAKISFDVTVPSSPQTLTLEKYTPFTTEIDGNNYSFVNITPITIEPIDGVYRFSNVEIIQGIPIEDIQRVYNPGPSERYEIRNEDVDTSSLVVLVQNSAADTTTVVYKLVDSITKVNPQSNVYYLEENPSGKYEIYFGDNILGRRLTSGNLVRLQYLITKGSEGNVSGNIIQRFSTNATLEGGSIGNEIIATVNSTGGFPKEDIDLIKFKAPKFYSSQNRAVTADDYKAIIQSNFSLIESIAVWGGEDNNPPVYGKVFISIKPFEGYEISSSVKKKITDEILSDKKIMSIIPEFITPEYIHISIDTTVRYDKNISTLNSVDIRNSIDETIRNYFSQNLQKFDSDFVFSKLSKLIDESDNSIIGNTTKLKIQKRISPSLISDNFYTNSNAINFNNSIEPGSLQTTSFFYYEDIINLISVRLIDVPNTSPADKTGTGHINIVTFAGDRTIASRVGTINYKTGVIDIPILTVVGFDSNSTDIRLTVDVQNLDIYAFKNQILVLDDSTTNSAVNRNNGLKITTVAETL